MMDEIILGDAYELIKEVPDKSIDLIVTDPPYLGHYGGGGGVACEKDGTQKDYVKKIKEEGLYDGFDLSILDEFVRVMKKINIYLFCSKEQIYDYLTYFTKQRKCNWELIVLAKDNPPPFFHLHYLKDKEYCLFFWERGVDIKTTYDTAKTVYLTNTGVSQSDKSKWGHPTIKPEEIIENLIRNSSGEGSLILDPFSGSGTTAACAKKLGRHYIGFEISPSYYEKSIDRLNGVTVKERESNAIQIKLF